MPFARIVEFKVCSRLKLGLGFPDFYGPVLDRKWTRNGPEVDQKGTRSGPVVGQKWTLGMREEKVGELEWFLTPNMNVFFPSICIKFLPTCFKN